VPQLFGPVVRHASTGSGCGLIDGAALRSRQRGAVYAVAGRKVPEPALTGFERLNDGVSGFLPMCSRVSRQRIIAAADVATGCTAAQMKPPAAGCIAFDAVSASRWNSGVDLSAHGRRAYPLTWHCPQLSHASEP
jgi:hypothetical protein